MSDNKLKFLVIGDLCEDRHCYGQVRQCPEAPAFIINPINTTSNLGMAGNVYENLKNLDKNIQVDFLHSPTKCVKTRYIDKKSGYILLRVDENDKMESLSLDLLKSANIKNYDCVVVSDYDKGTLTRDSIEYISNEAKLCFLDTKKILLGKWFKNITFIKINELEYNNNAKVGADIDINQVIVTLGERGASYNSKIYEPETKRPVISLSGAGDSFHAALAYKYTKEKNIDIAIDFANYIAGIACSQPGVTSKFDV